MSENTSSLYRSTFLPLLLILFAFRFLLSTSLHAQEVQVSTPPAVEQKVELSTPPDQKPQEKVQPQVSAKTVEERLESLLSSMIILESSNESIIEQLDAFSVTLTSAVEGVKLLTRYYQELHEKLKEVSLKYDEMEERLSKQEAARPPTAQRQVQDPRSDKVDPFSSAFSSHDDGGQYVRMRIRDKGQDLEFQVDPTYVDMNVDLKRAKDVPPQPAASDKEPPKTEPKTDSKADEEQDKKMMENIAKAVRSLEKQTVKSPLKEIDKDALKDLVNAQKLTSRRQFREALQAVRRSLSKQETAVGYALEGSIYFLLGDLDLAVRSWQDALVIDPEMDDVKQALNRYAR